MVARNFGGMWEGGAIPARRSVGGFFEGEADAID